MFWTKRKTKSEIYKPENGRDAAHNIVGRAARQLSVLGLVKSQSEFARDWLKIADWHEDRIDHRYSEESLHWLANCLELQLIALSEEEVTADDEGKAWVARNRLILVQDLHRKVAFVRDAAH